jgi:hypothetical protein
MGFEWQFGTQSTAGPPTNGKGGVENIVGAAVACKSARGKWRESASNVASLADQINNGPMLFGLLEVIQSQRHGFMPSQAAREQQR